MIAFIQGKSSAMTRVKEGVAHYARWERTRGSENGGP